MAVDRPTFSEAWHQVAELKPRLRNVVQCRRQDYRGRLWYVLRDPSNNKFFRTTQAGYHFIGLLDGRRSVAETWDQTQQAHGDEAPTQNEAIQLLGQCHQSNLLAGDLPMDARQMFQRRKRQQQREVGGYLMSLLFARIPLIDPDRFLDQWRPMFGWLFGPVGFVLWMGLLAVGLFHLIGSGDALWDQTDGVLAPANLPWLYASFALIKAIHELGHGIACKQCGRKEQVAGEVHTIGIMLLVLMPVPYVDASSSWAFRSKWRRAMVAAAGIYVELAVAAVAMIVWANTASGMLVHNIAYNVIFIASVSTLLFNGNPLLRYDAYYVLSDVLEIPNLNQRAKGYLQYLAKRYAFGATQAQNPAHHLKERFWLSAYAVASFVYRIAVAMGIFLFVAGQLMAVGVILLAGLFVGWVVRPLVNFVKYLFTSPELSRCRGRSVAMTVGVIAPMAAAIALVPVPDWGWAQGVVEPRRSVTVRAGSAGFLDQVQPTNAVVRVDGPPLVQATNRELTNRLRRLKADLSQTRARYYKARVNEPATAQQMRQQLTAMRGRIDHVHQRIERLRIAPAFAGTWVSPEAQQRQGGYLKRGQTMGKLITLNDLIVRVAADQHLGPRLRQVEDRIKQIRIRVDGRPSPTLSAEIERIVPAGQSDLPSAALSQQGGGRFRVKPNEKSESTRLPGPVQPQTAEPFFEVRLKPGKAVNENPEVDQGPLLLPGQRVVVRFTLPSKPLWQQVYLGASQMLQTRLGM